MTTKIIGYTLHAIDAVENKQMKWLNQRFDYEYMIFFRLLMHKLRGLRTFLLCLKKTDLTEESKERPRSDLLRRLEYILGKFKTSYFYDEREPLFDIESLEEELDQWYTSFSKASNSLVASEVEDIFNSVLENLEDFLSLHVAYVGIVAAPVEALKMNITFWRNFLRFATFLGTEQQEFLDLLANMEVLAFSAAHLTAQLFSARHYNIKVFTGAERNLRENHSVFGGLDRKRFDKYFLRIDALYGPHSYEASYERINSSVYALLLRINPHDNPHLHESYSRALENMKSSRESYVPNLDIQESTALLLSIIWEMLQFHTGPAADLKDKLQEMHEGLRILRSLFKKHTSKFDGEVGAVARAGIFDAGLIILSVYQNHDSTILGFEGFMGTIKVIETGVDEKMVRTSTFNFPRTTLLAFLDFLLNYLMEVNSVTPCFLRRVRGHLLFLRPFIENLVKNQLEDHHQSVWNFSVEVAYKIEALIDRMLLGNIVYSDLMLLQSITEAMEFIKTDSVKIFDDRRGEIEVTTLTNTDQVTSQSSISSNDEIVGFKSESKSIVDRLTRGSKKLQVVAIVAMPGLGKTTLATKVYNEPSVQQHFHVRAWCSISQEFNKRKVLLELLSQILGSKSSGDYSKMTEDDLAQELRRSLLQRRYLIYIDDVWEIKSFESLKPSFPGDSPGRILLTSRIGDVAKLDDQPHFLRQLTFSESLELLQKKVSPNKGLSQSLYDIAVQIAENCKGLPLIITIVAGLLATTKQEVWKEVLGSLTSGIISSTDQCERTIELSYKHLPEHLKPCLLSFGSFPEDEEISVKKLIWLWIAEGFVKKTNSGSVEEVAANYLKDLIGRSLVMNSQKRNGGGIKTCRIHDLLLDFCQRKSIKENALHLLNGKEEILPFEDSINLRRLCVHGKTDDFMELKFFSPRLRSLSIFGEMGKVIDISFIFRIFKLLRVLNMEKVRISLCDFPGEIGNLVRLRYLTITVSLDISPSLGNLCFLETLIIATVYGRLVTMPHTFWNLQKLRHLYFHNDSLPLRGIILPVDKVDSSCNMLELDSLSGLHSEHWGIMEKKLRKFPNIRRLKFWLYKFGNDHVDGSKVMSLSFLSRLESLTLTIDINLIEFEFVFPESLKKLHLYGCCLSWEKISSIAQLPNLEVLKLLYESFVGEKWQMEEGKFSKLKFLMLRNLDVVKWTGCDDQFPNLEKLVVGGCTRLEEIPKCLEDVDTLQMIEVIYCSDRANYQFKALARHLKDFGNSELQFHVSLAGDGTEDYANGEEDEGEDDA